MLAASVYLFRRLKTRIARWALIAINVLFLGSYLLFFSVRCLGRRDRFLIQI